MQARKFRFEQMRGKERAEQRERALLNKYKKEHGNCLGVTKESDKSKNRLKSDSSPF